MKQNKMPWDNKCFKFALFMHIPFIIYNHLCKTWSDIFDSISLNYANVVIAIEYTYLKVRITLSVYRELLIIHVIILTITWKKKNRK